MLLEGRSRYIIARGRSLSDFIFVSARQHVLVSDILLVRKIISIVTLVERKCKDIAKFFLGLIFKRTSTEAHVYMRPHLGAKC